MKKNEFLLDTNVFLWWITNSPALSKNAFDIILNPGNTILFSAISGWEICIKASLGRLEEAGDPELTVPFHAKRNNFKIVDFSLTSALKIFKLPEIHSDPFDRALIAQAQTLEVPIITNDKYILKYNLECIW